MFCALLLTILYAVSPVFADTEPAGSIMLHAGVNTVSVSVSNTSGTDIGSLKLAVDTANLPAWITASTTENTFDVTNGESVSGKYSLTLTLTNPVDGVEIDIPLNFTDSKGYSWNYNFHAKVDLHAPIEWALYGNSPNPFNPSTTIRYSLKESADTKLTIYNNIGQSVRKLVDTSQAAGSHEILWDGCDDNGSRVSSGIYLYTLQAGAYSKTMKMMLVK